MIRELGGGAAKGFLRGVLTALQFILCEHRNLKEMMFGGGKKQGKMNKISGRFCGDNRGKFVKRGDQKRGGQRKFDRKNIQCYACKEWDILLMNS